MLIKAIGSPPYYGYIQVTDSILQQVPKKAFFSDAVTKYLNKHILKRLESDFKSRNFDLKDSKHISSHVPVGISNKDTLLKQYIKLIEYSYQALPEELRQSYLDDIGISTEHFWHSNLDKIK